MDERLAPPEGFVHSSGSESPVAVHVVEVVTHHAALKTFVLESPFAIDPGRFVMLWLPGVDEKPFSPSSASPPTLSAAGRIELTVRAVGPFTTALMSCVPGQTVGLRGPFGRGFPLEADSLLVGGGMGIAPIRHLAETLEHLGFGLQSLVGARTARDLVFGDWFAARGAVLHTDDGTRGYAGPVTRTLEEQLRSGRYRSVCSCGPEPMLLAVKQICEACKVPYWLAFERYMKCGVGICGQCCMDGSGIRVCREGPVLSARELAGVTELGLPHRDATGTSPRG